MGGRRADVVLSDMAPNLSGIESADAARMAHLVELAVEFALQHLQSDGALVCKVFHGSGYSQLVKLFKDSFRVVKPIKPKASRDKSAETFLVGMGLQRAMSLRRSARNRTWDQVGQSRAWVALTELESSPYAVESGA